MSKVIWLDVVDPRLKLGSCFTKLVPQSCFLCYTESEEKGEPLRAVQEESVITGIPLTLLSYLLPVTLQGLMRMASFLYRLSLLTKQLYVHYLI